MDKAWLNLLIMQRLRTTFSILISVVLCSSLAMADDAMSHLPTKAMERSQITTSGSHPFVLRASVLEATNPSNEDYRAEIEEYWVAPDKWRRTVKSSHFSQTLIVKEEKTSEHSTGDYYPIGSARLLLPSSNPAPR